METHVKILPNRISRIHYLLFLTVFTLLSYISHAQPLYTFSYSTGSTYNALTTSYVDLFVDDLDYNTWDDGLSDAIPIGFTFVYNFKPYTEFKVNANGFMTLDNSFVWKDSLYDNYLSSIQRHLFLAPLWDDLVINTGGGIRYELTGLEGERILKIEFNNLAFWTGASDQTSGNIHLKYQVWLYEGTNIIEFRYGDDSSTYSWFSWSDGGISIGINDDRNNSFMRIIPGTEPSYTFSDDEETLFYGMENYVNDGLSYRFTPTTRWLGTTNNDWLTKTNWELDTIPTVYDNALIPDSTNIPIINASGAVCNNLTIESDGELTITGGGELTVSGDLNNAGTVTITATNETSNGSLIVEGSSDASINFERYLSGGVNWHLISSPVSGQNLWTWTTAAGNDIAINASKYAIADYVEENDDWSNYPTSDPGTNFMLGTGYSTLRESAGTVTFTGQINIDDVNNIPISYLNQGWNLLGNPFTSSIGATNAASSIDHLLSASNVDNLDPSYAGLYLWDPSSGYSGEYVIINNSGGSLAGTLNQDYIQAGQGFFVRAKDNSSRTFDITTAMQAHQPGVPLKSGNTEWPAIQLTATITNISTSTLIKFNSSMTTGLDITYDAGVFNANPELSLYSRLVDDNGVDFAIQCLPPDYNNLVIPFGLDAQPGNEVIFSSALFNLPDECEIILEDKVTGIFTSLKAGNLYSITYSEKYKNSGSLYLHTSNNFVTHNTLVEIPNPFEIRTNRENGYIQLISTYEKPAQVSVFDIAGRKLVSQEVYKGNKNLIYFSAKPGVYVVHIENATYNYSQKIIWTY
ncbi:T9SS type A sorting domain-containing protein [Draconibacterium sp. IB214405]|uniref:T9SS type A sorting domain-containing protein n=1 Tax=Draconibacterium sp. IB214405 TaxID=3097352 RepID=UPI002A0B56F7|nr:T9SS type A sorting domain-containing protein [Draconibacterium sp. IB214405]MDX8339542.1 T9SS type A sorting domain-containing protein [Draconibacterium sp. IB214405]